MKFSDIGENLGHFSRERVNSGSFPSLRKARTVVHLDPSQEYWSVNKKKASRAKKRSKDSKESLTLLFIITWKTNYHSNYPRLVARGVNIILFYCLNCCCVAVLAEEVFVRSPLFDPL